LYIFIQAEPTSPPNLAIIPALFSKFLFITFQKKADSLGRSAIHKYFVNVNIGAKDIPHMNLYSLPPTQELESLVELSRDILVISFLEFLNDIVLVAASNRLSDIFVASAWLSASPLWRDCSKRSLYSLSFSGENHSSLNILFNKSCPFGEV